jgi:hypothetical protein
MDNNNLQNNQPPQQPIYNPPPASPPGKGMAIASMVLGICSLVIPYVDSILAIIALVLGVISKKKLSEAGAPTGMATAGIVMAIIALAWSIVCIIICITAAGSLGGLAGLM